MLKRAFFFFLLLLALSLSASEMSIEEAVPKELVPWINWVMFDYNGDSCPFYYASSDSMVCEWSTPLILTVKPKGVHFSFQRRLYRKAWTVLPGGDTLWPRQVVVDGKQVPVLKKQGAPSLFLSAGTHVISGTAEWQRKPKFLRVPADIPVVAVLSNGKRLMVTPDKESRVWFDQPAVEDEKAESERVGITVYRNVKDDIPLIMVSQMRLSVSGREREITTGQLIPEGFAVVSVSSPLPLRIEHNGSVRIRVKAGEWTITVTARQTRFSSSIKAEKRSPLWPEQEIWFYTADTAIRDSVVKGVPAVDTSHMDIPAEWRSLPAFLVKNGTLFTIVERARGQSQTPPDQPKINRQLWLDFDGEGFTFSDTVTGVVHKRTRMSMVSGFQLGSVTVNGQPQLITRIKNDEPGVEVRKGRLDMTVVGRCTASPTAMPLTGWKNDADAVSLHLHLPPGWQLFYVSGADYVSNSWVSSWDVWDLFVLFLLVVLTTRLISVWAGLISLVTGALIFHDESSLLIVWIGVTLLLSAISAIPSDKMHILRKISRFVLYFLFALLFVDVLMFSVNNVRIALYPQLEHNREIARYQSVVSSMTKSKHSTTLKRTEAMLDKTAVGGGVRSNEQKPAVNKQWEEYDVADNIQTGPGVPAWRWNSVTIKRSGPVIVSDTVSLYVMPPFVTIVLRLLKIVLLVFLVVRLFLTAIGKKPLEVVHFFSKRGTVLLLLSALFVPLFSLHATVPPDQILYKLRERLVQEREKKPDCFPHCAVISDGSVVVNGNDLTLTLHVDSAEEVAFPLPRFVQWYPDSVMVNSTRAFLAFSNKNDEVAVLLPQGKNVVRLTASLTGAFFSIPFATVPHNIVVRATGWDVSGVVDGVIPDKILRFEKRHKERELQKKNELIPAPVKPFVAVERTLLLQNDWKVRTVVTRKAPIAGAFTVTVPLLPGESVTSEGIRVESNGADIAFSETAQSVRWTSRLKKNSVIVLSYQAPDYVTELWRINASPKWHVTTEGLLPIKDSEDAFPSWRPRPGERLTVHVVKPVAVQGKTKTVRFAGLNYKPGKNAGKATLTLDVKSSTGNTMQVTLPPHSRLKEIKRNDKSLIIVPHGSSLSLPLLPGEQTITVSWDDMQPIGWKTMSPKVSVSEPVSNIRLRTQMPRSRWILLVSGPPIGPAILVWGVVVVLFFIALILGRIPFSPLKTYQWMLLFIGMVGVSNYSVFFVIVWLLLLMFRKRYGEMVIESSFFNLLQLFLAGLSVAAVIVLIAAIPMGLLSSPEMHITGNGSYGYFLQWYQDSAQKDLPQGTVISVPIEVFRVLMLLWSLWLAAQLPRLARWGWSAYTAGALWKKSGRKRRVKRKIVKIDRQSDDT